MGIRALSLATLFVGIGSLPPAPRSRGGGNGGGGGGAPDFLPMEDALEDNAIGGGGGGGGGGGAETEGADAAGKTAVKSEIIVAFIKNGIS